MYVERLLQINVAALACLAALLLGMGQRSTLMPLAMVVAAMASVWITDIKGWFRLSKRASDLAALGALAACLPGALRLERIVLISAVANFVVLLQVIQLFRSKDASVYWQVMRLSVLQVVVAALLTQEMLFGVLLVAYLFTALGAMALSFLYSEWSRHRGREPAGPANSAGSPPRWPLAAQKPAFWSDPVGRAPVGREFFARLLRIGLAALAVGALVFVAVPRVGSGAWRGLGGSPRATVGFSGRMRLGELGRILQNPQEVMRVRLWDSATGAPYETSDGIYLRGAVLTEYQRGEWRPPSDVSRMWSFSWVPSDQTLRDAPVRQEIHLEPLDRNELFCVWPFTFLRPDPRIAYFPQAQRMVRRIELCHERFAYELGTTAFQNHEQVPLAPSDQPVAAAPLLQMPLENGQTTVPGLVSLARQWLAESELPATDRHGRAILLERRMRDSGRFSYSLQGQVRDRSLDPIEDFVSRNPQGHCEYFATALCLMLRSQGIPARVVIGFRATESNRVGDYFLVRQRDAHSWVEAYLPPTSIPDQALRERPSWHWLTGGWLRLDATPESREMNSALSLLSRIGGLFDRLNFAWTNYVMEMDRPRQRDSIYQPIARGLQNALRKLTDPDWWRGLGRWTIEALGLNRWWTAQGAWLFWRNVGLIVLVVVLSLGAYHGLRRASRRWGLPWFNARANGRRAYRARVEFYRRFEAILARHGLVRRPSQTQREFALAAAATISEWLGDPNATPALDIVEAFYLVRFGGATLDEPRAQAVEHALTKIAQSAEHRTAIGGRV